MKRRDFLTASATLAGIVLPAIGRSQSRPCPPPVVTVAGGQSVSSACVAAPKGAAPSWFVNMQDGSWTTIAGGAGQRLTDVVPNPLPSYPGFNNGQYGVTNAWSGGCFDQDRGEYILAANGGHADYVGNEVYALTVTSETPAWRRLTDPTPNNLIVATDSPVGGRNDYADGPTGSGSGRPRALHTAGYQVFGDGRVWILLNNSKASPSGGSTFEMWSFDRESPLLAGRTSPLPNTTSSILPWEFRGMSPISTIYPDTTAFKFGNAVYSKINGRAYAFGGEAQNEGPYWSMSTRGATIGQASLHSNGSTGSVRASTWAVMCDDLQIIVIGSNRLIQGYPVQITDSKIAVLRIADVGTPGGIQNIDIPGGSGYAMSDAEGAAYVPATHAIAIAQTHSEGHKLFRLGIPTTNGQYNPSGAWSLSQIVEKGTPPVAPPNYSGNYNKVQLVNDMGNGQSAIVLVTDVTGPTYVYKVPLAGI